MKKILIVEDEYFLATDLQVTLQDQGISVVGPIGTLADAMDAARSTRIDLAVLDINLHGEMAYDLIDMLRTAGVPVLLATGYSRNMLPQRMQHCRLVEKPYTMAYMLQEIDQALSEAFD